MASKNQRSLGSPRRRRSRPADAEARPTAGLPDWTQQIVGAKHICAIEQHIAQLRESDPHGNRELFLDQVLVAYLLAFFNPTLRTLRTIENFSQTRQAQKLLSIRKLSKSTLSDFNRLADPSRLRPIFDELRKRVGKPGPKPNAQSKSLQDLHKRVLATDGTFLSCAADVVWSVGRKGGKKSGARLDFQVDVDNWLPELVVVPVKGQSEAEAAAQNIKPDAIHLYDRGIFSFDLIRAHATQNADFVMRFREPGERTPKLETVEERALTDDARAAGVLSDRLVRFLGSDHREPPKAVLREVVVVSEEKPDSPVHLLTTLMEPDASNIGQLYRHRWQVELFFRWLKCYARFDHLISESREGVLLSFYVAVIGVTLLYLHTGCRPSKYLFSLMTLVASGAATWEEIVPILREQERRSQLERDRVARKRAEKQRAEKVG